MGPEGESSESRECKAQSREGDKETGTCRDRMGGWLAARGRRTRTLGVQTHCPWDGSGGRTTVRLSACIELSAPKVDCPCKSYPSEPHFKINSFIQSKVLTFIFKEKNGCKVSKNPVPHGPLGPGKGFGL